MDLAFSAEDLAFRDDVRGFLRDHLPAGLARRESQGFHLSRAEVADWQRTLYAKGWVAPNWPKEFGGTGWNAIRKYIFDVECGIANAPEISLIALSMVGPVLCRFGSPELQRRFLDPILRGDLWFCQGFSEPQSGSDLASVRTRAVRDGGDYVVSGQKTWTTAAHMADYMICLCRTDADVKPQAGLSMLLLPMDAPGVTVRPIATIDHDHTVNEVFLDDVRVPATNLVGEPDSGWQQARFLLGNERTHNAYVGMLKRHLLRIVRLIDAAPARGASAAACAQFRRAHALLEIDVDALEWSALRVVAGEQGAALDAAASALKIRGSEYLLRAADLEMEIVGRDAAARFAPDDAPPLPAGADPLAVGRATQYLYWRASTIFGGANEIQRSIIWNTLFRA
ncbi:MAG TPA: acyl-CoA dehydrogenase family protein [Solimonas sp.]|nr:acyl-CoA dehydrogenase family protein [Solimonas sp.]